MAESVFVAAVAGVEGPRRDEDWREWLTGLAGRLRRAMLRYRDGAKVLAGTFVDDESMWRTVELTLRTLEDAGFGMPQAGRVFPILLHYTIGYVIEEQARMGADYDDGNPYRAERLGRTVDAIRFPRAADMVSRAGVADPDAEFDYGLRVVLAGVFALRED